MHDHATQRAWVAQSLLVSRQHELHHDVYPRRRPRLEVVPGAAVAQAVVQAELHRMGETS